MGYNVFAYCNNNPSNYSDLSGNLACQNSVRMSNDGGGTFTCNGNPKRREPRPTRATDITPLWDKKIKVDSDSEIAIFYIAMTCKIVADVGITISACAAMLEATAAAPSTAGASVALACTFATLICEGGVGVVSDITTLVQGGSEYNKDGSMTIGIFKPSSAYEAIAFFITGPIKIED